MGPVVSYWVSGSNTIERRNRTHFSKFGRDDIHSLDFELAIGAGVDFSLGPGEVTFDLRLQRGFVGVPNDDNFDRTYHSLGVASVGYVWPL